MATKTAQIWYLSDKDKEEIKSYSKKLTIFCKVRGYKPGFWINNFFLPVELSFIPCIKEWIDYEKPDSFEYYQDVINAINSAYDPSIKISLEDLKEIENYEKLAEEDILMNMLIKKDLDTPTDLLEFICSCGDDIKKKFINWIAD